MATGIYAIENTATGMIYLGQAMNTERRWITHITELNAGRHGNRHLQAAWNLNGAGAFKFSILENCTTEALTEREQHYLDTYMPLGFCYNIVRKAHKPATGVRFPKENRQTFSIPSRVKSVDLDDYEKVLIRLHRKGDRLRFLYYLMAVSKSDEEMIEILKEIQIEIDKRSI